jgi:hypothetical protein
MGEQISFGLMGLLDIYSAVGSEHLRHSMEGWVD